MKFNKEFLKEALKEAKLNSIIWLKERAAEKSSRKVVLTFVATALGVTISPESLEIILSISGTMLGYIGITTKEK